MPQGVHLPQIVFVSVFHDKQQMIRRLVVLNYILHVRLGASVSCPHNNSFSSALARGGASKQQKQNHRILEYDSIVQMTLSMAFTLRVMRTRTFATRDYEFS